MSPIDWHRPGLERRSHTAAASCSQAGKARHRAWAQAAGRKGAAGCQPPPRLGLEVRKGISRNCSLPTSCVDLCLKTVMVQPKELLGKFSLKSTLTM